MRRNRGPRREKVKDMMESVLPSVNPKTARVDRRLAHRRARARARQDIIRYNANHIDYSRGPIHEMMRDRRERDKVAPIMRWAVEVTKHLDTPQERLAYVKGVLPHDLIGRHAISHIEVLEEFETNPYRYSWLRSTRVHEPELNLAEAMHELIEAGEVRNFNRAIKRSHTIPRISYRPDVTGHRIWRRGGAIMVPCDHQPRVLLGLHDIEPFLKDIKAHYHPEWYKAMNAYLENRSSRPKG